MIDPLSAWKDLLAACRMVGETMSATNDVVASRSGTIAAAARDPLHADHRELSRMVSEKGRAFTSAGQVLAGDWSALQKDFARQSEALGAWWLSGRWLSLSAAAAMVERGNRINRRAFASGIRALTPIHAAATANQKRLAGR